MECPDIRAVQSDSYRQTRGRHVLICPRNFVVNMIQSYRRLIAVTGTRTFLKEDFVALYQYYSDLNQF